MIIAAIVLYAGITSLVESAQKIIEPEVADYSTISLVIIASAVVVKILLGRYVKGVGERVNSGSLIASGKDALFDAVLSASVLASALIFITTGISLEAYVGALISVFIIKAGIEMIMEAVDEILGKRADKELTDSVKETICEAEGVTGAYDLILHSYGPDRFIGSVHVEVPASMTATEIDELDRSIARRVFEKHGIVLAGIGVYAVDDDDESLAIRNEVTRIALSHDNVLQVHGFRLDRDSRTINLDVILDYAYEDREALYASIVREIQSRYPDYRVEVVMDIDI
jgi:cation diffusion facilitator family transporter